MPMMDWFISSQWHKSSELYVHPNGILHVSMPNLNSGSLLVMITQDQFSSDKYMPRCHIAVYWNFIWIS